MREERVRKQRKRGSLSCGQMGLIFLIVLILAMAAAVVLGYALGIFDELVADNQLLSSILSTPTVSEPSLEPGQASPTPEVVMLSATATLMDLMTPIQTTPTPFEAVSTPVMPTQTPSITPIPPADVCAQLNLSFLNATSNVASWRLQNSSGVTLEITRIDIIWPEANDAIFNALLDGEVIWSGEDLDSPTAITEWMGDQDDREVIGASRLEFFFGITAAAGGYDLTIGFTNGCEVSSSN